MSDSQPKEELYNEVFGHGPLDIEVLITNTNSRNREFYSNARLCGNLHLFLARQPSSEDPLTDSEKERNTFSCN